MRASRTLHAAAIAGVLFLAGTSQAEAQIRRLEPNQSISFNLGYFALKGEDARVTGDVLLADLTDIEPLAFNISDFNGVTFGGEWLVGFGEYLEGGVGVGFYQRTVPSVYANLQHESGREIEQELKLRVVPLSFTVRFLPVGRGGVEPYVGAGLGVFPWRYSEVGEFVDTRDFSIFRDRFVASGTSTGALVLGGIRFPVGGAWNVGGELRYQKAEGTIDVVETDLLGDRIDLGGWTATLAVALKF